MKVVPFRTIALYSFYPFLCKTSVDSCLDKKYPMYLNRFDDDQSSFGYFIIVNWLFFANLILKLLNSVFKILDNRRSFSGLGECVTFGINKPY